MTDPLAPVPLAAEKRTEARISCSLKALYHPQGRPALFTRWGTCIRNVSRGGLGLLLPLRLRHGTRLVVELPASGEHDSCTLEVATVRSQRQPDGNWVHGCVPVGQHHPEQLLQTLCSRHGTVELLDPLASPEREEVDRFVLYLLAESGDFEQAVASFATHPEARRALREFTRAHCDGVIRFVGPTGGGD